MDLNEEIAKVAYELFERDGRQNGKDREHWLEAERIVTARRGEPKKAGPGKGKQETAEPIKKEKVSRQKAPLRKAAAGTKKGTSLKPKAVASKKKAGV